MKRIMSIIAVLCTVLAISSGCAHNIPFSYVGKTVSFSYTENNWVRSETSGSGITIMTLKHVKQPAAIEITVMPFSDPALAAAKMTINNIHDADSLFDKKPGEVEQLEDGYVRQLTNYNTDYTNHHTMWGYNRDYVVYVLSVYDFSSEADALIPEITDILSSIRLINNKALDNPLNTESETINTSSTPLPETEIPNIPSGVISGNKNNDHDNGSSQSASSSTNTEKPESFIYIKKAQFKLRNDALTDIYVPVECDNDVEKQDEIAFLDNDVMHIEIKHITNNISGVPYAGSEIKAYERSEFYDDIKTVSTEIKGDMTKTVISYKEYSYKTDPVMMLRTIYYTKINNNNYVDFSIFEKQVLSDEIEQADKTIKNKKKESDMRYKLNKIKEEYIEALGI